MMSVFIFLFVTLASAHTAAWASGMYCRGGNTTTENQNTKLVSYESDIKDVTLENLVVFTTLEQWVPCSSHV